MATGDTEILRDYFPVFGRSDRDLGARVSAALVAADSTRGPTVMGDVLTPAERQGADRAMRVSGARRDLRRFLDRLDDPLDALNSRSPRDVIDRLYRNVRGRSFDRAFDDIDLLDAASMGFSPLTGNRIQEAFTSADIEFAILIEVDVDPGPRPGRPPIRVRRKQKSTLKGYRGDRFSSRQIAGIVDLSGFLAGGAERDYRVRLLRAECHVGLAHANEAGDNTSVDGHYQQALTGYQRLLPPGSARQLNERQKFVAFRAALAQVSRGDALFRRSFRLTDDERKEVVSAYCAALQMIELAGGDDRAARQVAGYANQQISNVSDRMNFLGYRDSHVPDLGPAALAGLAERRIAVAKRASERFERFKASADDLVAELEEMAASALEREVGVAIAAETKAKADQRVRAARAAIQALGEKSDNLTLGLAAGLGQAVFATLTLGGGAGGGTSVSGQASGPGVVSALVQYLGAKEELANQQRAAESTLRLAQRDLTIAQLEESLANSRLDFARAAIQAKQSGSFNADRFYALANAYEEMTRRHLDRACELLYLYERAVSFRRLKALTIVESSTARGDPLIAADDLEAVLIGLNEEALSNGRGQNAFPLPPWSLRTRYPLEFAEFLQTGSMDFVISVYELERLLHGRFNVRVRRIGVEVIGLLPPEGFVGRLTHGGVTLVRQRDATINATRLAPTESELAAALRQLEDGLIGQAVVQGLVPFVLGEDSLSISSEEEVPLPDDGADFDLLPIEGYGLTGGWRLNVPDVDLRNVADVRLRFIVSVPAASQDVDDRVVALIREYERELAQNRALDAVLAVSLRQRFPDAFDALATGVAELTLTDDDFTDNVTDRRVKAVLAQTVDDERAGLPGIVLEIARGQSVRLTRTTGQDGFTEDLSVDLPEIPEPDRPEPTGSWQLRLLDPAQFDRIGDFTLFILYSFSRV